jgi:hypothetical protein
MLHQQHLIDVCVAVTREKKWALGANWARLGSYCGQPQVTWQIHAPDVCKMKASVRMFAVARNVRGRSSSRPCSTHQAPDAAQASITSSTY